MLLAEMAMSEVPWLPKGVTSELLTLADAARLLPKVGGRKIAISTLWRWCTKGLRGEQLQYIRMGRRICTSQQALLAFFSRLTELDECADPDSRTRPRSMKRPRITSGERLRALAEADKILQRARI